MVSLNVVHHREWFVKRCCTNSNKNFLVSTLLLLYGPYFIQVKGLQVAPNELEDLIRSHPAVLDAAVIGVPDDRSGELPRGYIVKKPGRFNLNFVVIIPCRKIKLSFVFKGFEANHFQFNNI